ncbi:MAG: hypothetical protein J2P50_15390 [Hyphomicrobiaceae bacterium]|nr:hypothetical protein [Hyphomicrobiaceae bacterium]
MADAHRSVPLAAEAATTEAAREANAVVLDGAVQVKSAASLTRSRKARGSGRRAAWSRFAVDVWITNFNSVEFGIYKHSRNRAKSRQFTSDMDIFAEVIEDGERTGLLGYREDLWRKNAGMDKRLVMKLFNETLNWRATLDLMIGRSLQLTLGARRLPVTCFSINAGDHDNMIYVERSANKWPLAPEHFSFFLLEGGRPQFYRLRRDVIDLGGDYTLYSHRNEVVGRLDGAVFSIGGKWVGAVHPDHANPRLLTVLKLFCGMLIFNGDCRRHVRRLARDVLAGRYEPKLEKQEADLYMNPRRVR